MVILIGFYSYQNLSSFHLKAERLSEHLILSRGLSRIEIEIRDAETEDYVYACILKDVITMSLFRIFNIN